MGLFTVETLRHDRSTLKADIAAVALLTLSRLTAHANIAVQQVLVMRLPTRDLLRAAYSRRTHFVAAGVCCQTN
jgi:hypothetical protein